MITRAEYIIGNTDWKKCPKPDKPEFAFIGRSNVGKSSLVNALTQNKKLAKISSTPGKTRIINHFLINKSWYLVDLPGYGYAKVSKTSRQVWAEQSTAYLLHRENLMNTFILIDSRLTPQKIDLEFINWCGEKNLAIALIFTKSDKCKRNELKENINAFQNKVLENWEALPPIFITSSIKKTGIDELVKYIESCLKM